MKYLCSLPFYSIVSDYIKCNDLICVLCSTFGAVNFVSAMNFTGMASNKGCISVIEPLYDSNSKLRVEKGSGIRLCALIFFLDRMLLPQC